MVTASPADAPVGSPESGSTITTGDGSKSIPSAQEDGSSDGRTAKLSISSFIILILATSYSSIFLSH
ncbi:Non-specific lipid-transfer protein isoform 2 [Hibiscus syriacus]|uniref:Non-specific lipid-transfer protein isoform 2 n=1 Tax=Hibiscus syriacus TaxID=106335 RepID=A0A6A3C4I6_HIBSY|nr:Non-specific lipid-transfer protein isoform 2 [Hibiscus syriacus]